MPLGSIRVKVISITIAALALSAAFSIYITLTDQRSNLLDETRKNLTITGDILSNVIGNIMRSGEAPIATKILADIQGLEEFTDIAIYRTDGTIAFHDEQTIEMVNLFLGEDRYKPSERADVRFLEGEHFQKVLDTGMPLAVESTKERKFEYFLPILNDAECRACHGDTGSIRGIAHFEASTDQIYQRIGTARNTLTFFSIISGIVIIFVLFLLLRQIIIIPLLAIGSAVEKVGKGDLEVRVVLKAPDELGSLASEVNGMIGGLKDLSRHETEQEHPQPARSVREFLEDLHRGWPAISLMRLGSPCG